MLIVLKIIGLSFLALLILLLVVILYAASGGERIIESTDHNIVQ